MTRGAITIPFLVVWLATAGPLSASPVLPYQAQPFENLTVSGQPTLDQLRVLSAEGYTTIINLRRPGEFDDFNEAAEVAGLGMIYVHIPVKNIESIDESDAQALHAAISSASGPILLHCTIGWRAAGLLAIEQYLLHEASAEAAEQIASDAHMGHAGEDVSVWIRAN